ncbi:TolC family protein [Candidatus Hakubella thermalkaliphila]|nr:TolC family protein [Candidatus Hakubella thermalkaliphila]
MQDAGFNPPQSPIIQGGSIGGYLVSCILYHASLLLFTIHCSLFTGNAFAGELHLQGLIDEALKNNPEILASESRFNASKFRIPQAKSLPDPMLMFGYLNEWTRDLYTFGDKMAVDSQWMFSVSQMFPFPGKLELKGEMTARDAESLKAL